MLTESVNNEERQPADQPLRKREDSQDISRNQRERTLETVGCCKLGDRLRGWVLVECAN